MDPKAGDGGREKGDWLDEHLADMGHTRSDFETALDTHINDLSSDQITMLQLIRDRITVEPGTVMQKVITVGQRNDYLDGTRTDTVAGFTARAGDVTDLDTPRKIYDQLALNYDSDSFQRNAGTIHVIRYVPTTVGDHVIPRHGGKFDQSGQVLADGGPAPQQGTWDKNADAPAPPIGQPASDTENPFTGLGFTGGGKPEFVNGKVTRMEEGAEMWELDADGRVKSRVVV